MEANGASVINLWKMAAHSPTTLPHLIRMGNAMLTKTRLDPKLRELAILRTAELIDCEYERSAHTMLGKELGLTDAQIKAVRDWKNSAVFNEVEAAVLQFTDEVAQKGRVKDTTFAGLAKHLDNGLMVELAQTIGLYGMIARILLPFEVDIDEQAPASATQIVGRSRNK